MVGIWKWAPTVLLALLLAVSIGTGAGLEMAVVGALITLQALVIVLPIAADWVGQKVGERQAE